MKGKSEMRVENYTYNVWIAFQWQLCVIEGYVGMSVGLVSVGCEESDS